MRYILIVIDFYNLEEWRGYYMVEDITGSDIAQSFIISIIILDTTDFFYEHIALLLSLRIPIKNETLSHLHISALSQKNLLSVKLRVLHFITWIGR